MSRIFSFARDGRCACSTISSRIRIAAADQAWINAGAEFIEGDLRDRATITAALDNIDLVFHQAAYGGYMPEISKYVHVNSLGTAQMLEVIREKKLPIQKIIVASSQAVYSEGAGTCPKHGLVFPGVRPVEQLRNGDWQVHCPICGEVTQSAPTPENSPVGGETVYGLTKAGSGKAGFALGKTSRDSHRRAALLMHLRTPPIDFQSLHRGDRNFLHAFAQPSPASPLRRRRANTRFLIRGRHRTRESACG